MGLRADDLRRFGVDAQRQILRQMDVHKSKYNNQPTTVGNIRFDSKKEAQRYSQLMSMLRAGAIRNLKLQRSFVLQDSYTTPDGERVRAITYVADFCYERQTDPDCNGQTYWLPVVEDVKSRATKTEKYIIKKKLMQERYNISITEI